MDDPLEEREEREHHQRDDRVGDLPVAHDDPRGHRDDKDDANHPRGGVLPELPRGVGQREPCACGARSRGGHRLILQVIEGVEQRVVAGSSRSCAARLARAGSPAATRRPTRGTPRPADLVGHHSGQRGQRRFVGGAQRVVHQPECDRIRTVDDVVPELSARRCCSTGRPRRPERAALRRADRPVRGRAAGRRARRPWDRYAAAFPGCCGRRPRRVRPRG